MNALNAGIQRSLERLANALAERCASWDGRDMGRVPSVAAAAAAAGGGGVNEGWWSGDDGVWEGGRSGSVRFGVNCDGAREGGGDEGGSPGDGGDEEGE